MVYNTQIQSKFHHVVPEPPIKYPPPPVHVILVHFPIAFNTLAWGLDILYGLTTTVVKPEFLTVRFGAPSTLADIARLSYFLMCAGLLVTVPTILSGNVQLVGMIKKNGGPWAKDADGEQQNYMVPRIKQAITHALMNDVVFLVNLASWWMRKDEKNAGHVPSPLNMGISAALLPIMMFAASLGAGLVFNHGVGMQRAKKKDE